MFDGPVDFPAEYARVNRFQGVHGAAEGGDQRPDFQLVGQAQRRRHRRVMGEGRAECADERSSEHDPERYVEVEDDRAYETFHSFTPVRFCPAH